MSASLAGQDVLSAELRIPRLGAWHANVESDGDTALSGSVELDLDGSKWQGTILPGQSGVSAGRVRSWVVGGKGGLQKELAPRHYHDVSLGTVVGDILRESGESLAPGSETSRKLSAWQRLKGPAAHSLVKLVDHAGLAWRVLGDGKIWIGTETWPAVEPNAEVLDEDWMMGTQNIAPADDFADVAALLPGTTFGGHRIEQVVHHYEPRSIRTILHFSQASTAMAAVLGSVRRLIEYQGLYRAKVVAQNADGTLQLSPEDQRLAGSGLDKVRIRHGLPGYKVKVPSGTYVRVGFDGGDPEKPFAALWDEGDVTEVAFDGGTRPVARVGDSVTLFFSPGTPVPFTGIYLGNSISGALTLTSPAYGVIGTGNPKGLF